MLQSQLENELRPGGVIFV
jgi:hypothetical protein